MGIIISVLKLLLVVKRYQNIIWSAPLKIRETDHFMILRFNFKEIFYGADN